MPDVSRETADVPSASLLTRLFGDDSSIRRYVDILTTDGVERGLLGPREAPRVWTRHILNCAVVAAALPRHARIADIGSGAGLPGVVWAIARSDVEVVLIEPLLRRSVFLDEVVERLELRHVSVQRARAEEVAVAISSGRLERFDVATARAVTALPRLVDLALPLLRPSGVLLALKGASAGEELASAQDVLTKWRVRSAAVIEFGSGDVSPATTVVRIESGGSIRSSPKVVR